MTRFEGIADDAVCAIHTMCLRKHSARPGPTICAICARLDSTVLAVMIENHCFMRNYTYEERRVAKRELEKQVHSIVAGRNTATQSALNQDPKSYVCVTQDIDEEGKEWKKKYRPQTTMCALEEWKEQDRGNVCEKCLPGMKEHCAAFFGTMWNEHGVMWSNVRELLKDVSDEDIKKTLEDLGFGA